MCFSFFFSPFWLYSRCISVGDATSLIASAVNASGAIHFLSLFNVTAPGLDLCLFKKKGEREEEINLSVVFRCVYCVCLVISKCETCTQDKSSGLIPHWATWLIFFMPCFFPLHFSHVSPSLSLLFSSLPLFLFAPMVQLIKLREEVSSLLLLTLPSFIFPHICLSSWQVKATIMNSFEKYTLLAHFCLPPLPTRWKCW